jgi:16S rRNA G966 N2-methylase RsmD
VSHLSSDVQGGATLDLVAGAGVLNHDAALRRIARASTAVDQESGATAHVVRTGRVQVVAVVHALEGAHVAEGVGSLRNGAHGDLALAAGIVAARA